MEGHAHDGVLVNMRWEDPHVIQMFEVRNTTLI